MLFASTPRGDWIVRWVPDAAATDLDRLLGTPAAYDLDRPLRTVRRGVDASRFCEVS